MKTSQYIPVGVEIEPVLAQDSLLRSFLNLNLPVWPAQKAPAEVCCPPLDIRESADSISIVLEAPGMRQEDFSVVYEDGTLKISGKRPLPETPEGTRWLRKETSQGSFSRSVEVPCEIKSEAITASYRDGILSVSLPKSPRSVPLRVEVK